MTTPRIIALSPMPPEATAYALGRYSRSADGIEQSLRWVAAHDSAKFLEQFYYSYGHASLADVGKVTLCCERISELAAIYLEDESLWDGQQKSTRYQRLTAADCYRPIVHHDQKALAVYERILGLLYQSYERFQPTLFAHLASLAPRPQTMTEEAYTRTLNARVFDSVRYFLPLGSLTNVGQVVSIRTLEKQITRLRALPIAELRSIGEEMQRACAQAPLGLWDELQGRSVEQPPLAPTLAKHCEPNQYQQQTTRVLTELASDLFKDEPIEASPSVTLIPPHEAIYELATTLLYPVTHYPYSQLLAMLQGLGIITCEKVIDVATQFRGPHHDLLPEFQIGSGYLFDILMDIGGWRDLHRHRRCVQTRQGFTLEHGPAIPPLFPDTNLTGEYQHLMTQVFTLWDALTERDPELAQYAIPFGFQCRSLFRCSLSQVAYLTKLRTGPKGHPAYRQVAWDMYQQFCEQYPFAKRFMSATSPSIQDPLIR